MTMKKQELRKLIKTSVRSVLTENFLTEKKDSTKEIIEIKGKHLLSSFKRKSEAAEEWCKARKIKFRVISKY